MSNLEQRARELVTKWRNSPTGFVWTTQMRQECANELEALLAAPAPAPPMTRDLRAALIVKWRARAASSNRLGLHGEEAAFLDCAEQLEQAEKSATAPAPAEVPSLWRLERCTIHVDYDSDCLRCREEVL